MKATIRFLFLCLTLCLLCAGLTAQDSAGTNKYAHQLRLIDSLKAFISNDLGLDVPGMFYDTWQADDADSMYCFLYLSFSSSVDPDTSLKIPRFFHDEALAIAANKDMQARGYHTLLYKTAGLSNALLSRKLLSYPDEAIAFIIFHEVTHRNLQEDGNPVPYVYEESLCDAVADLAIRKFARKTGMLDIAKVEKQQRIFEEAYSFINEKRAMLDTMLEENKPELYRACTQTISAMTIDANQFQKDRMRYEVNNAYFLRMGDYALHYFKIKGIFGDKFDFKDAVARIKQAQESNKQFITLFPNIR